MIAAIILARGNSRRVPRKQMRRIGGTPLVGWSVRECVRAFGAGSTYVNTEDQEIASEARKYGALVIDRPESLQGSDVTSEALVRDTLGRIESGPSYNVVVLVQCTSPFTTANELGRAAFATHDGECVFAVDELFRYEWAKHRNMNRWVPYNHNVKEARDGNPKCVPLVVETGAFYSRTLDDWRKRTNRHEGANPVPMPVNYPIDIDTLEDLERARAMYRMRPDLWKMNAPASPIRRVVFDVDGVLTDGCTPMRFSRRDGAAIARMKARGVEVAFVTAELPSTEAYVRALFLGVPCHHVPAGERLDWIGALSPVCYVADSNTDADALAAVGCGIAPSDAMPEALAAARYIVGPGGRHIAEQVEAICSGQG